MIEKKTVHQISGGQNCVFFQTFSKHPFTINDKSLKQKQEIA